MLELVIYGIVGVLAAFIAVGTVTVIDAMRKARKAGRGSLGGADDVGGSRPAGPGAPEEDGPPPNAAAGIVDSLRRYVGPVGPEHRLLNTPARIAMEFGSSLFGFPGLGWLMSGKVVTGIALFVLGPGLFYAFLPAYFVVTGRLTEDPYLIARMLPVVAVISAGSLAIHQTGLLHSLRRREV